MRGLAFPFAYSSHGGVSLSGSRDVEETIGPNVQEDADGNLFTAISPETGVAVSADLERQLTLLQSALLTNQFERVFVQQVQSVGMRGGQLIFRSHPTLTRGILLLTIRTVAQQISTNLNVLDIQFAKAERPDGYSQWEVTITVTDVSSGETVNMLGVLR